MQVVYINGRFLTQNTTGVQRVAEETLRELDTILNNYDSGFKIILLTPKNTSKNIKFANIEVKKVGFLSGHIWEQLILPFKTKGKLLLNFCNTGPVFKRKQIVVIHDAAIKTVPQGFSKKFVYWYRILYWLLGKNSKSIVTVSEFSKKELMNYYPSMRNKITTIYNGVNHILRIKGDNSILKKYDLIDKEYILAVSSANPNKNFQIIPKSLSKLKGFKGKLIIAGAKNNVFSTVEEIESGIHATWVGYVTDEELVALYKNARAFVFPSIYEGFGLPPLEAMILGCTVISSNSASMAEILDDYAILFNPYNEDELAEKILEVLKTTKNKNSVTLQAQEHAQKYTWSKTAQEYLSLIAKNL